MLHETKKIGSEFPIGVDLQQAQQDILPPVPISTKLEGDMKQQIMNLYPDLFSGFGTIKMSNQVLYQLYVHHVMFPMQFNSN